MRPYDLTCNWLPEPTVSVLQPKLAWKLARTEGEAESGLRQTAYQILVATEPNKLEPGKADLWDSGMVPSSEQTCITYAGKTPPLFSHAFWRLRVWNQDEAEGEWSEVTHWHFGPDSIGPWKAEWIGFDRPLAETQENDGLFLPPPRYLRTRFSVEKPVTRAMLYGTALGLADLYVNGQPVAEEFFLPGWTDYTKRLYYRAYEVTDLVQQGGNALGAVLADGWYAGYVGFGKKREHYGRQTRLLAMLRLEHEDGTVTTVGTGETWKASTNGHLSADFLMGEEFDASSYESAWATNEFDDSSWREVDGGSELEEFELTAHPGPPVVKIAEFSAQEVAETEPGVYVLDVGRNIAGVAEIRFDDLEPDQELTLRFGERLDDKGKLYTENLREARATDRYTAKGGDDRWMPKFTYHGFQYVEVRGLKRPPREGEITAWAIGSDTPRTGYLQTSDNNLNRLVENIYWTQRANFVDIPTDCPQRDERLGWTGDAQIYVETANYFCDVKAFFAKWLQDLRDAQRPDGQFPMVAPLKVAEDDGGPGWAEAGVLVPWSMYRRSGDLEFLTANYPAAKRYIEFELGRCRPGPLPPEKYHCFGDWLNVEEETPHDVIYLAYLYRALNTGALMAYELGETTDEATFRQQAQEVQASFISHYTGDEGQIAGDSQTAYAVATVDGLLDKSTSLGHLKRKLLGNDGKLRTGFLGTRDLMNALEEAPEVAYQLLLNRDYPGWLFSISHGATSIWERWNGWTPQGGFGDPSMNSFSHYAFGAVAEWMFRNLAGFASLDPLVIRPVPSPELSSAQAAIEVPQGEIRTRWEMSETRLFLEVEIPPNLMASVDLSRVSTPEAVPPATRVGPGKHNFEIVARS